METLRYEFVLQAEEPIAHHSESFGNEAVLMRRKVRQPDGRIINLPCITADTMRHGLREAGTYALLDAAKLTDGGLSEGALRLLFAGGMVTGSDGGSVRLEEYREMSELIPTLSLFGGCARNRVIPGRLRVSDATLICGETWHFVPEWIRTWCAGGDVLRAGDPQTAAIESHRSYVEEVQRVRMDPLLDPGKRKLLTGAAAGETQARLTASETASAAGDPKGKDEAKSSAMPRRFERIIQGALFTWRVEADVYSDLDRDTFMVTVAAFLFAARVGGKRGTGHGLLRAVAAQQGSLPRVAERGEEVSASALGASAGTLFRTHVAERADRIREFLSRVDA